MADFAIVGMGRFGRAVARHLAGLDQAVLAIDRDRSRLDQVSDDVEAVAVADSTDEEAMRSLQLERLACVVVTIGSRAAEASVLTTAILRELRVPRIVARAFDDRHARLLLAIGAHEILNPEEELANQLALRLAHPGVMAEISFADAVIAEIEAPESLVGVSLRDLDLRNRQGVAVLAIRRDGATLVNPGAGDAPASGDILVLLGPQSAVRKLAALK
jgi:trk system potassium uptake protein TrkA